jgi:hypothetical protein
MTTLRQNKKSEVFAYMIADILQRSKVHIDYKRFIINYKEFIKPYDEVLSYLLQRIESNEKPSKKFIEDKFHLVIPSEVDYTPKDISEMLKDIFIQETITTQLLSKTDAIKSANLPNLLKMIDELRDSFTDLQDIKMEGFDNKGLVKEGINKTKDKSNIVYFNNFEAMNLLEIRDQQLIGILAASGCGKSLVLEKIRADLMEDYFVLDFSLEHPFHLYMRRLITSMKWCSDTQVDYLTDAQVDLYVEKLASDYPHFKFLCLDTHKGKINIAMIEKMAKHYSKVAKQVGKKLIIIIDYVQLLEEDFDPNNCRVNKYLHDIAVRYDATIFEGMQGNDDATKYNDPPETSMIAFVKSLKNDCDIIQSYRGVKAEGDRNKTFLTSATKKHRMGKYAEYSYLIDHSTTKEWDWTAGKTTFTNKKVNLSKGTNSDYDNEGDE